MYLRYFDFRHYQSFECNSSVEKCPTQDQTKSAVFAVVCMVFVIFVVIVQMIVTVSGAPISDIVALLSHLSLRMLPHHRHQWQQSQRCR